MRVENSFVFLSEVEKRRLCLNRVKSSGLFEVLMIIKSFCLHELNSRKRNLILWPL